MLSLFRRLSTCERAATPLEYTLIAALLGLAALQVGAQVTGSPVM
jgi:Flp pilus assembly pilin Flp